MAARAQRADVVNQVVRRQIEHLKPDCPLAAAMQEWHRDADEVTRREIEAQVQAIADTVRKVSPTPFGPGQALEVLGALIARRKGWKGKDRLLWLRMFEEECEELGIGFSVEDEEVEA